MTNAAPRVPWPHQARLPEQIEEAWKDGHRSVLVTSPTGGGKSDMMTDLARRCVAKCKRVGLFSNRRIVTGQLSSDLAAAGVDAGVMAADHDEQLLFAAQTVSTPSLHARAFRSGRWQLPDFNLVLIDEAHAQKGSTGAHVVKTYLERGAFVVGFTATPIGMAKKIEVNGTKQPLYSKLIVAGTKVELRKCGAIVPCHVFAPDEPDTKGVNMLRLGEDKAGKLIMETIVFANVFDHWLKLNPCRRPTLLWAPGVEESRWFAAQFQARGVTAVNIDGNTSDGDRDKYFAASRAGEVTVLCSCGVLREGANLPWIWHGVLVQACVNLQTYLQQVGRLLRAYPDKEDCVLQDHAGAWHRHGSPNIDHTWTLGNTEKSIAKLRLADLRDGKTKEPIRCPKCGGARKTGTVCPHCKHEHVKSVRSVRMTDGTLKQVVGDVVKKKRRASEDPQKVWTGCLFAAAAKGRSVGQAAADFKHRLNHFPHGLSPLPEQGSPDWKLPAGDVYPWLLNRRKAATL